MARQRVNGIELYYERTGVGGDTVVLVHGSWTDHCSWQFVVPALSARHRVLSYDRRGHSRSERPPTPGCRRLDEDDLATLIETLDIGPVHVVGNSYGGSIALGMASRRPDLVRSVVAHEPPLLGIGASAPLGPVASVVHQRIDEVGELLRTGDLEGGAQHFIDAVAFGPGVWRQLPEESRRTFVANASTFLDMLGDPHWDEPPSPGARPVLLSEGDASPAWLPAVVDALATATYRHADRHTFNGAGHVPHLTHPLEFAAVVVRFVAAHGTSGATSFLTS